MANDLSLYSAHAEEWWNPASREFRSLHAVSHYRLALLAEHLGDIAGKSVLDIGSGGGLLAVPLARQGARVTAVDLSFPSLRVAVRQEKAVRALQGDATKLPFGPASFDIVLLADVLEHIPEWRAAVSEGTRVLKRGGVLFAHTLNRTFLAYLGAILVGEKITKLIPVGTHDWNLFIRPGELIECANERGLTLKRLDGESPRILQTVMSWAIQLRRSKSVAVSYSALFEKNS